jgi:hypothetical protein
LAHVAPVIRLNVTPIAATLTLARLVLVIAVATSG